MFLLNSKINRTVVFLNCLEGLRLLDQNIYIYKYLNQTNSDAIFQPACLICWFKNHSFCKFLTQNVYCLKISNDLRAYIWRRLRIEILIRLWHCCFCFIYRLYIVISISVCFFISPLFCASMCDCRSLCNLFAELFFLCTW